MLAPERRELILQDVLHNKSATVKDLCTRFGVTGETIRKDLTILEQEGKLLKTYGGAYIQEGVSNEVHASLRQTIFTDEKNAIAKASAALVSNGDTIILDESTTCLHIAKELTTFSKLTVLTNSVPIVNTLSEYGQIQIVLLGGLLNHKNLSFVGNDTLVMLENYYADKAFVSCRGVSLQTGITDGNPDGGLVRKKMLQRAGKRYLVADSSKLGHTHFYHIADFDLVDYFITDKFPPKWDSELGAKNIKVIKA